MAEEKETISAIVSTLGSRNENVVYTATGAILNTSMDNEPLQSLFVECAAISKLSSVISGLIDVLDYTESPKTSAVGMATRALSNLVETGSLG